MNIHTLQIILILLGVRGNKQWTLFKRLHLPPILGYLIVGILVGPFGSGVIASNEETQFLAEFGVVFLLFAIGLEFSLPQMIAMKGAVFGLGGSQVLLTALIAGGIAWLLGTRIGSRGDYRRNPGPLLNRHRHQTALRAG